MIITYLYYHTSALILFSTFTTSHLNDSRNILLHRPFSNKKTKASLVMAPSKASKGKGPARIDDNKTIAGVAKLSKEQLFNSLEESGIKFDENSLKPELQAVWALRELGLVTKGESPDEYLLNHATNWFSMSVKELIDEIKERNYNDAGNRWDRIEALIRDE